MNIEQLPYIATIAQTGNLSKAARELGISQPALSKYLRELESTIHLPLFSRTGRQLVPTEAGLRYIQASQKISLLVNHTKTSIQMLDHPQYQNLRIGVSPNRGVETLSSIYPDFSIAFPNVRLQARDVYAATAPKMLLNGELDGAITTYSGTGLPGLHYHTFNREEMLFAVPSSHPLADHDITDFDSLPFVDLEKFRNEIFLLPEERSTSFRLVSQILAREHYPVRTEEITSNIIIHMSMIQSGLRVGFLPAYYLRPNCGITFFRLKESPSMFSVYITPASHQYTQAEDYLLYLLLRYNLSGKQKFRICWDNYLRELMWRFDPVRASALGLEALHEH